MRGERDDIVSLEGRDGFHGNNEENKCLMMGFI